MLAQYDDRHIQMNRIASGFIGTYISASSGTSATLPGCSVNDDVTQQLRELRILAQLIVPC